MEVQLTITHKLNVFSCEKCGKYYALETQWMRCPCCAQAARNDLLAEIHTLRRKNLGLRGALKKAKSDDLYEKP